MKLVFICVSIILICSAALYRSITYEEPKKLLVSIYESGYTAQARTRDGKCLEWTVVYNYPKDVTVQINEIKTIRSFIGQRVRSEIIGGAAQFKDCK